MSVVSRVSKVAVVFVSLAAGVIFLARTPWVFTPNPPPSTFVTTTTFVVSPPLETTTVDTTQVPNTTQVVAEPLQPVPSVWPGCATQSSISQVECDTLVAFYDATGGVAWTNRTGWLVEEDPCEWFGVTCDDGSVTGLVLFDNLLSGSIPSVLGNLTNLQSLQMYFNRLTGPIPPELGSLTNLTSLDLSNNQLIGSIPPELGRLAEVSFLVLAGNQLSGSIPSELGSLASLEVLDASDNQLSGEIPATLQQLEGTLVFVFLSGQTGCLTSPSPGLTSFLDEVGSLWNDGC
jgi:Leucine Rich Repeat (LRR) protein